jgi:hypothetical protein
VHPTARLFLLAFLLTAPALATPSAPRHARGPHGAGPAPRSFGDPRPYLARFAKARGGGTNTLCVVGYESPRTKYPFAEIYWKEADTMILWEGGELSASRRILTHADDVVATDEEVGSSTYLVTEEWWTRTKRECAKYGKTYVLGAPRAR